MRPINLIPPEERRSHGDARTGPLAYILVGGLAVILIGIVMLVLTSNQIGDKESEITKLEAEKVTATARAEKLAPYTSFHQLTEQRVQTVSQLADSRFDWPRVIREMGLILPPGVYFSSMTGSAGGGTTEGGESGVAGPSLLLEGCAPTQIAVAAFVASLKDIDGVTRVGLKKSKLNEVSGGVATTICAAAGMVQFEIVTAFDGAPPSPDGAEAVAAEEAEASETEGSVEGSETESESGSGEGEGESGSEASEEGESTGETASSTTTSGAAG